MTGGVYEIVNLNNGKRYIGSAVNFENRWRLHRIHLTRGTHHSRHLQASWSKNGAEVFCFRPLVICDRRNNVMYEQAAMDVLRPEFNVAPIAGSCLGLKHTDEARAKMSASKIGNRHWVGRTHTPETLARMTAAHTGKISPLRGNRRPRSAVEKTAAAHRGMKRSPETRAKIAAKAAGRRWTDEAKRKVSATLTGRRLSPEARAKLVGNRHAAGHRHTDEWKRAASARMKGSKRPKSPEHRAKIAAALRGRKATPEARANQSAAQRGKKRGPRKPKSAQEIAS